MFLSIEESADGISEKLFEEKSRDYRVPPTILQSKFQFPGGYLIHPADAGAAPIAVVVEGWRAPPPHRTSGPFQNNLNVIYFSMENLHDPMHNVTELDKQYQNLEMPEF